MMIIIVVAGDDDVRKKTEPGLSPQSGSLPSCVMSWDVSVFGVIYSNHMTSLFSFYMSKIIWWGSEFGGRGGEK